MSQIDVIYYLSIVSGFIPLFFFILRIKPTDLYLKVLLVYFLNAQFFDVLSNFFYLGKNNLFLLHIYTLLEGTILFTLFFSFFKGKVIRNYLFIALASIYIAEFIQQPWGPYLFQMNPITRSLESLFVVFFSLLYFYRMLSEMKVQDISRDLMFWVSTAFLMYFGGNFILFLLSDQLIRNTPAITGIQVFVVHSILQMTLNTLLSIGIWRSSR